MKKTANYFVTFLEEDREQQQENSNINTQDNPGRKGGANNQDMDEK
jgi:hypothetical protein